MDLIYADREYHLYADVHSQWERAQEMKGQAMQEELSRLRKHPFWPVYEKVALVKKATYRERLRALREELDGGHA